MNDRPACVPGFVWAYSVTHHEKADMSDTTPQARGRKPQGDKALTDRQRAAQYRRRLAVAAIQITDDLAHASDAALLKALGLQLRRLRAGDEVARNVAARVVQEIVTRHGIEIAPTDLA